MNIVLRIQEIDHRTIVRHLLKDTAEQAVFLYASVTSLEKSLLFEAQDYRIVPPGGFAYQGQYYIELTDEEMALLIKRAWELQTALVEIHSHPTAPGVASFSPSDLSGLKEMVPHVRWRLKGKPYLALVLGPRNFDALAWTKDTLWPEPLNALLVNGQTFHPTGETLRRLSALP